MNYTIQNKNFDIRRTFLCGQCFRWSEDENGAFSGIAGGRSLTVTQSGDEVTMHGVSEQDIPFWENYFDLGTDYSAYIETLSADETLKKACEFSPGIRILRQEPFETLISFIISQNNNIPRIKGCIERLCERFGGFPDAGTIAKRGPKGLDGLGLGYRQDYIIDAAITYHGDGDGSMERILRSLTYEEAMNYLTTWRGIGPKVANCICLYGLGHKEAFPRDVWVKRIEAEHFGGHFPDENYPGFAGVLQQYIFFYERSEKNGRK